MPPSFCWEMGHVAEGMRVGMRVAQEGEEGTGGAGEGEAMGRSGNWEASHSGCSKQRDEIERMG